jgi:hypothetical protein
LSILTAGLAWPSPRHIPALHNCAAPGALF